MLKVAARRPQEAEFEYFDVLNEDVETAFKMKSNFLSFYEPGTQVFVVDLKGSEFDTPFAKLRRRYVSWEYWRGTANTGA